MKNLNRFYVYAHVDDNGVLFYIGKGTHRRAYVGSSCRYRHWKNHVNKYCATGKPAIIFLKTDLTEEEALSEEVFWISFYGRKDFQKGQLINKSDGGDGFSSPSEETIQKRREFFTGKKLSEEHKKKLSLAKKGKPPHNKGKPMSDAQRKLLSEINKGRTPSEETRRKLSEAGKGRQFSEETRRKMSETQKGRKTNKVPWNKGLKTNIPAWNKGVPQTEETKLKLHAANKGKIPHYTKKVVDLQTGIVYKAASLAAAAVGLKSAATVRNHCNGVYAHPRFSWEIEASKTKTKD